MLFEQLVHSLFTEAKKLVPRKPQFYPFLPIIHEIKFFNDLWIMDNRVKNLWELENWPKFSWHIEELKPKLDNIRLLQGRLLGKLDDLPASFEHQAQVDILVENVMRNRGVENQMLTLESFLLSVGNSAVETQTTTEIEQEPIGSLLNLWINITQNYREPVSQEQLGVWHTALFAHQVDPQLNKYCVPNYEQMAQYSIQGFTTEEINYEPPTKSTMNLELLGFLHWFNHRSEGIDGLLRAGIAHLWFMALKPYKNGNGRMARVLTDLALAQTESESIKYYSFSSVISGNRNFYNKCIANALTGNLCITEWLVGFLTMLEESILQGISRINHFMRKTRYWQKHSQTLLNARQLKLLNDLLNVKENNEEDTANINASKYMNITRVSEATATRELTDLLEKHCLRKLPGGGRSTTYVIAR